jgi:hemerythrin-like metal-binding protein
MASFQLTDDLLTGIEAVDEQHRILFELANDVVETSDEKRGSAFFERTSAFLKEYIYYHFACEEMVMLEHHYPKLEAHSQRHASLRAELATLVLDPSAEGSVKKLNAQLCFFIEDLVVQHVRTWDREMAAFYRAQNIRISLPSASTLAQADSKSAVVPAEIDEILANRKSRPR